MQSTDQENIVLIGMPGCGKSTVGVLLAKALGRGFVDTDLLLQARAGRLLQQIVDQDGMQGFLHQEEQTLLTVASGGQVVATGGSAVYSKKAMAHLKKGGQVVYLRLPLEEIQRRVQNIATRGIAMGPGQTLADLYRIRIPLYEKYADLTVDCAGQTLEQTVQALCAALGMACAQMRTQN